MSSEANAQVEPALAGLLTECLAGAHRKCPRPVVLLVDDSPTNIDVLAKVLEGYDILFATRGAEALERAAAEDPDLILLDVMMPDLDGFEVCQRLKADERLRKIPVVFVTALSQEMNEARGLDIGAVDYVTKPINSAIVRARVRNHLELKLARDLLERRAVVDGLTGLANRRRFDEFLEHEWRRAARNGLPLSLVMLDIDLFKDYNDLYGHPAGDACLRQVAGAVAASLKRPADLAARFGGDELACLLPETDAAGACLVAQHIRDSVGALALPHGQSSVSTVVTVSEGVVTSCPACEEMPTAVLVEAADRLLYAAKRAGRNRMVVGQR